MCTFGCARGLSQCFRFLALTVKDLALQRHRGLKCACTNSTPCRFPCLCPLPTVLACRMPLCACGCQKQKLPVGQAGEPTTAHLHLPWPHVHRGLKVNRLCKVICSVILRQDFDHTLPGAGPGGIYKYASVCRIVSPPISIPC